MNIGLDWDGTCSEDIQLFLMFVKLARASGHKVYIVTMRYESEINDPNFPNKVIPNFFIKEVNGIICTGRQAKRKVVEELGIKINVWIDDNPLAVEKSASEIWGYCTPKGVVISSTEEVNELRSKGLLPKESSLSSTESRLISKETLEDDKIKAGGRIKIELNSKEIDDAAKKWLDLSNIYKSFK